MKSILAWATDIGLGFTTAEAVYCFYMWWMTGMCTEFEFAVSVMNIVSLTSVTRPFFILYGAVHYLLYNPLISNTPGIVPKKSDRLEPLDSSWNYHVLVLYFVFIMFVQLCVTCSHYYIRL